MRWSGGWYGVVGGVRGAVGGVERLEGKDRACSVGFLSLLYQNITPILSDVVTITPLFTIVHSEGKQLRVSMSVEDNY